MSTRVVLVPEDGAHRWPADVPLPEGTVGGERRFELETRGPWGIVSKCRALAVLREQDGVAGTLPVCRYTVLGDRDLLDARESGYQLEGRVSVGGRKRRAFTGSLLIIKHDGERDRLYDLAVLHVVTG